MGAGGTHIECASTMFGTILSYIALRLLGEEAHTPYMCEARDFITSHGGALYAPSWAKFWMAVIGFTIGEASIVFPPRCGFFRDGSPFTLASCGVTAEWCTCPCATYTASASCQMLRGDAF